MAVKIKKKKNEPNYGVYGSRRKESNFCDEAIKSGDKIQEFSCEK